MKKLLIYTFIFALFTSCGLTKKTTTTSKSTVEKTEILSDSTSKEVVNKKIDDSAIIKIAESETGNKDFDLAVNRAVANILKSINFQKSSGDNSYKVYYDDQLKALRAEIKLGETKNKETTSDNATTTEKTVEEQIEEYIKKIVIPWWMYVIGLILAWKFISPILFFIFPQLKGLRTLKDVLTPPNKKAEP